MDSHITIVRASSPEYALYLGFWAFAHERYIESLHTGSTGQTELPRDHVKSISLVLPDSETLDRFNAIAEPATEVIVANQAENRRLSTLRDILLPKLMSGEIDVSKVDLMQLNSHLAASSDHLSNLLTSSSTTAARQGSSHPSRRSHISVFRYLSETRRQARRKLHQALLPCRKIGRQRWRNDGWQPATCGFVGGLRNYLPIFRQAAASSSSEGHNLPHITKKSGPLWVPTRQFMVAGAGFEPTTFGL